MVSPLVASRTSVATMASTPGSASALGPCALMPSMRRATSRRSLSGMLVRPRGARRTRDAVRVVPLESVVADGAACRRAGDVDDQRIVGRGDDEAGFGHPAKELAKRLE